MRVTDLDPNGSYTYADYLKWPFEYGVELIDGKLFVKSSSPGTLHQEVLGAILFAFGNYLRDKSIEVLCAPLDVRLPHQSKKNEDITTVVQPDILVVCDRSKFDERGCLGAPDIVIEVFSPGDNRTEAHNKFRLYQRVGIKEYWIVLPSVMALQRYFLEEEGRYIGYRPMTVGDVVTTPILPGFALDLEKVFKDIHLPD